MNKVKIVTIIGARPQFVKAAVVSRALSQERYNTMEVIVHTGQHYDTNMSDVFFEQLGIPKPHYHLGIGGGTHGENTGRMIEAIEKLLMSERPDWVLVYGDTDSTLAGALAAAKLCIPVAHVEAGLRSFNRVMPEEINRILTDHASSLLLTPSDVATNRLLTEGISADRIFKVGDVMYEATLYYGHKAEMESNILAEHDLRPKQYVLATLHRAENVDDRKRLSSILEAFNDSKSTIVLPLHPRTRNNMKKFCLTTSNNVKVIDPVGYFDMLKLERNASLIATDSGGVQKEAYFHKVPCITLRDETEWVELIHCGANTLVGANSSRIRGEMERSIGVRFELFQSDLYGDGNSASTIAKLLSVKKSFH